MPEIALLLAVIKLHVCKLHKSFVCCSFSRLQKALKDKAIYDKSKQMTSRVVKATWVFADSNVLQNMRLITRLLVTKHLQRSSGKNTLRSVKWQCFDILAIMAYQWASCFFQMNDIIYLFIYHKISKLTKHTCTLEILLMTISFRIYFLFDFTLIWRMAQH